MSNGKEIDFVAIGDIVTDAFIRLHSAEVLESHGSQELCVLYGAKIAYDSVTVVPAVGNCANAAVAAARLGIRSALWTHQGDDDIGARHLSVLDAEGVSREYVHVHPGLPSNYHYVLWFKEDRTILVKHEVYPTVPFDIAPPAWVYLTSLGESSGAFHQEIGEYLEKHPEVKLAFQPGTFQIKMGVPPLAKIYARSELFFCNKEEAETILSRAETDVRTLALEIAKLGPKYVVITDGPQGAYGLDTSANSFFFVPPYPDPKPPFDRTGAGDAFASTVTAALLLGKTFEEALLWGPVNSMSVVQKVGAREGLLARASLESFVTGAPKEYRIQTVE